MKRHVVLRIFGLLGLYVAVFIALVLAQYARRTAFTLNLGSMVVSSNYLDTDEIKKQTKDTPIHIQGPLSIFFGGMEFRLAEEDGFSVLKSNGVRGQISGQRLGLSEKGVQVELSDGSLLMFKTFFSNGVETLSINATLADSSSEIRLPFRPLRSSHISVIEPNRFLIAAGGKNYTFSGSGVDYQNRYIILKKGAAMAAYGMIPEKKGFNPADLVLPNARDTQAYGAAINRWLAQSFALWERSMSGNPDEDTVLAYVSQAARTGNYRNATGTIPVVFLDGSQRTYRSSAFFGRLDLALRGLASADRESLGRLSRMINEKTPDILAEPDLVKTLSVRGSKTLVDEMVRMVKALDPNTINPATAVGVIDSFVVWKNYGGNEDNPFERLLDQALFVASGILKNSTNGILIAFPADHGDLLYTIRLGNALIQYGQTTGLADWADLGKTLILSALSLADTNGSLPSQVDLGNDRSSFVSIGDGRITAAKVYPMILGELYYPRIENLKVQGLSGLWAWTAAGSVAASYDGSVLDISAQFFEGETHYMMIKGIKPFMKIQLYNIDFRTDPRFERYDSSGWAYSESEQTLLIKMKHREKEEHIRVFYK